MVNIKNLFSNLTAAFLLIIGIFLLPFCYFIAWILVFIAVIMLFKKYPWNIKILATIFAIALSYLIFMIIWETIINSSPESLFYEGRMLLILDFIFLVPSGILLFNSIRGYNHKH